jgi:hypothetical protein
VILAPPFEAGAANATLSCWSPAVIPVIVGAPANAALTLLLAIATVWLLAPIEVSVTTWLLYEPTAAFDARRRYKVPFAKPPVWAKVAVLAQFVPSLDTWNPVGAVAVMLAVRLPPVTVTVIPEAAEADPNVLLTAANVPLGVIVGTASTSGNVKETARLKSSIRQLAVSTAGLPVPL